MREPEVCAPVFPSGPRHRMSTAGVSPFDPLESGVPYVDPAADGAVRDDSPAAATARETNLPVVWLGTRLDATA